MSTTVEEFESALSEAGYKSFPDPFNRDKPSWRGSWQKTVRKDGDRAYFVNLHLHEGMGDLKPSIACDAHLTSRDGVPFNIAPFPTQDGVGAIADYEAFLDSVWTSLGCRKYDERDIEDESVAAPRS